MRKANSELDRQATVADAYQQVDYTYETNRDLMTAVDNRISGSSYSNYAYSHDALGRRTSRGQSGSAFAQTHTDTFAYNTRSEVTGSTNSVLTGSAYTPTYTYDKIGNRESSTGISPVSAYTTNQLNQYTAIGATNPTHDADGNLTSNGTWTYSWNGENRLRTVTKGTTTINFTYDYLGRLVKKDDGTNTQVYLYDGWNRVAAFNVGTSTLTLQTAYLWGLDLSGFFQGAGGVGGLLKEGNYYPIYDAHGNITQKLNGTGTAVMNVDYDPFGNIVSGSLVGEYGFSTKPLIDGIDWYYYGFRYYDPVTGRWPSRDPIGERGGINLYAMVGNNSINAWDYLGTTSPVIDDFVDFPGSPPFGVPSNDNPNFSGPIALDCHYRCENVRLNQDQTRCTYSRCRLAYAAVYIEGFECQNSRIHQKDPNTDSNGCKSCDPTPFTFIERILESSGGQSGGPGERRKGGFG